MTDLGPKLSAWLDGELPEAEAAEVEALLDRDPALQAELDALAAANRLAGDQFAALLAEPVPLSLARAVETADRGSAARPANDAAAPRRLPPWAAMAASVALVAIGAAGGWLAKPAGTVAERNWIDDIAEYHALYAAQGRHLAEVPASDAAHLVSWLSDQTGVNFVIPDLAAAGLTFEGGRLLAAAGKPVGQLMYRDAGGEVVAICFIASDKPADPELVQSTRGGFDFLWWGEPGARFVVIGPEGAPVVRQAAEAAEQQV